MLKKIFSITLVCLSWTFIPHSFASGCTEKCGVIIFENKTLVTVDGVSVNNEEQGKALAGTENLPPLGTIKLYFNDKTKNPITFSACANFEPIPTGCIGETRLPTNSCSYPK